MTQGNDAMSQASYAEGLAANKAIQPSQKLTLHDAWALGSAALILLAFLLPGWVSPGVSGISLLISGGSDTPLYLVPLAGILSVGLTFWAISVPRQRRLASILIALAALVSILYYHRYALPHYKAPFNTPIPAETGFWLALIGTIGLAVQVFFRQARHNTVWDRAWERMGITLTALILFLVFWEMVVLLNRVPRYVIPRPTAILEQYFDPRISEQIVKNAGVTALETLVGFAVAISLGVPLAMFIAFTPFLNKTIYPLAVALEMVPKIAFAPLFVTWFGFGFPPKIIVVFMVCFFPIMLNGVLAFKSLNADVIYFAQSTGATAWRMFWKIRLPAAMPQIFNGLKGAATNATVGAVIAEWIGADQGLGFYLQHVQGQLRTDVSFAVIFVLAAMGLALFYAVVIAERIAIPWHVSLRIGGQVKRE